MKSLLPQKLPTSLTALKQSFDNVFDTVFGGLSYRIRGGYPPSLPRPFCQLFLAVPYAAACKWGGANWSTVIVTFLLVTAGFCLGHGQYQDLAHWTKPDSPEPLDFIVAWFWGPDNWHNYWRDATGLLVSALAVTVGPAIILTEHHHWKTGLAMFLSAICKPLAYMIGWGLYDHHSKILAHLPVGLGFNAPTEVGEFLTGAGLWLTAGLIIQHIRVTKDASTGTK